MRDTHAQSDQQLSFLRSPSNTPPLLAEPRRRELYASAARVLDALRATSSETVLRSLRVRYIVHTAWDESTDRLALAVLGPSGDRLWLTRRMTNTAARASRFAFRLWGRTPARFDVPEELDVNEDDALPSCDVSVFVAADFRLGHSILGATHHATSGQPLFVWATNPIPGWPP